MDSAILVQLAIRIIRPNAATVIAVDAEIHHSDRLVIPALIVTEFLQVVTHAKRFDPPFTFHHFTNFPVAGKIS
jgi:hypothetical protein